MSYLLGTGMCRLPHWLVSVLRPNLIVELGTHNGTSYAAFCNAVDRFNVAARCYAVDTWSGDPHAGFYPEYVYSELNRFIEKRYSRFSTLLRCFFEDALPRFEDGSIDLLHIDGLHTYEAVRHDFETWKPKLSNRGVILFHDTCIVNADFGVHQLWDELTRQYPGFNFHHSAGLGVLAVGPDVHPALAKLCAADQAIASSVRQRFETAAHSAYVNGLDTLRARPMSFAGRNIALGCQAWQSSFEFSRSPTPQGAVNGHKNGCAGFHTTDEAQPWWKVDLGSVQPFQNIVIYNRIEPGCEERARNLEIYLSDDGENWTLTYQHNGDLFGGIDGRPLPVSGARQARYVKIKLRDKTYLHLDEVEIYQS